MDNLMFIIHTLHQTIFLVLNIMYTEVQLIGQSKQNSNFKISVFRGEISYETEMKTRFSKI
jgi:hypothetical protein